MGLRTRGKRGRREEHAHYAEEAYEEIRSEFTEFAQKLTVKNISFVPVSALHGDNVVERSERTPWYRGGPLLHKLEHTPVGARKNRIDFRFPVQYVLRPHAELASPSPPRSPSATAPGFRGYAGTVASGPGRGVTCSNHAPAVPERHLYDENPRPRRGAVRRARWRGHRRSSRRG